MAGHIAIVGLGRTGAAIGLGLKRSTLHDVEVWGHDKEPEAAKAARRSGAIDKVKHNLPAAVSGAKLVVLAAPASQTPNILRTIASSLVPGSVVTDTRGAKASVLRLAKEHLPDSVGFVAGHPVPALNKLISDAVRLFEGGTYCIVASNGTPEGAFKDVTNLATLLGATPYFMSVEEHDSYRAVTEVLPTLLSAALIETARESGGWQEILKVAGPNFGAATLSGTIPPMDAATDAIENREMVLRWLDDVSQRLAALRSLVDGGDQGEGPLADMLARAFVAREDLGKPADPNDGGMPALPDAAEGAQQFFFGNLLRWGRRKN
jgi:prephenate dehydrogenase